MKIYSHEEMIKLGKTVGHQLKVGNCLLLKGDLASGKTTFTKGIGKALNSKGVINSPTFNILKIYEGDITLYHIDAYRLEGNDYDLGLDENMDEVITVIEWPEFYPNLPKEYLEIIFKYIDDTTREVSFKPNGEIYNSIVESLKEKGIE